MNLQMTLHLAGLNRNTYNTIERRTGLPFMKRALLAETGHDRYTLTHATALGCMLEFQAAGVELKRACEVTDDFFGMIDGIVFGLDYHRQNPERSWLTLINFADGNWGFAGGEENADTFGGGVIASKVSINVLAVWDKMASRLGSPIKEGEAKLQDLSRGDSSTEALD